MIDNTCERYKIVSYMHKNSVAFSAGSISSTIHELSFVDEFYPVKQIYWVKNVMLEKALMCGNSGYIFPFLTSFI